MGLYSFPFFNYKSNNKLVMSEKEKVKKVERAELVIRKGCVPFRIGIKKGFNAGQLVGVPKKVAEGWAKRGQGEILDPKKDGEDGKFYVAVINEVDKK